MNKAYAQEHISLADMQELKEQACYVVPQGLREAWRSLSPTELAIIEYIYDEFQRNLYFKGDLTPVLISRVTIGKKINKQKSIVSKAIESLRQKGWLLTTNTVNQKTGAQWICKYYFAIPSGLRSKVFSFPKRAAKNKSNFKAGYADTENESETLEPQQIEEHLLAENAVTPEIHQAEISRDNLNDNLLERYNNYRKECESLGITKTKACIRAMKKFSNEEQIILNEKILSSSAPDVASTNTATATTANQQQPYAPSVQFSSQPAAQPVSNFICNNGRKSTLSQGKKVGTNHITKYQYVNNINREADNFASGAAATTLPNPDNQVVIVDDKKIKNIRAEVTKNVLALVENNLIPPAAFNNGKKTADIIEEIVFHATNYNGAKIKSPLHAMRAALKMLKTGSWDTPKKIKCQRYEESIALERQAAMEKQQHLIPQDTCQAFLQNICS